MRYRAQQLKECGRLAEHLAEACGIEDGGKMPVIVLGGDPRGPGGWLRVPAGPSTAEAKPGEMMKGDGWDSDAGFPLY